ncbi:MAG: universal stress protein UspA [Hyphomicrobiales bacterium]|nr:MAG: universal stress protein UspA [Hyphomicrobiales bacterium]
MALYDKILVPMDGSENAFEALKMAIELQKLCQAELFILSVYREHRLWNASVSMVNQKLTGSTDDAMEQYAKDVAENSKAYAREQGVETVRSFYMGGGPSRMILKFTKDHDIDLIVLGSRGISDSEKYLLGSVSHKVTSLAECPVLVV